MDTYNSEVSLGVVQGGGVSMGNICNTLISLWKVIELVCFGLGVHLV